MQGRRISCVHDVALVTFEQWRRRSYWILGGSPEYGVCTWPLQRVTTWEATFLFKKILAAVPLRARLGAEHHW